MGIIGILFITALLVMLVTYMIENAKENKE